MDKDVGFRAQMVYYYEDTTNEVLVELRVYGENREHAAIIIREGETQLGANFGIASLVHLNSVVGQALRFMVTGEK